MLKDHFTVSKYINAKRSFYERERERERDSVTKKIKCITRKKSTVCSSIQSSNHSHSVFYIGPKMMYENNHSL